MLDFMMIRMNHMDNNLVRRIKNREDFLEFMNKYVISDVDDIQLKAYLESVESWVEDMDGFYGNLGLEKPENVDWSFIATLFYVGKIYE